MIESIRSSFQQPLEQKFHNFCQQMASKNPVGSHPFSTARSALKGAN